MSALTIQNFPPEMLAQLRDRAARSGRTVDEELIFAVERSLKRYIQTISTALEDEGEKEIFTDEHVLATRPADSDTGPCAFERPVSGPAVDVPVGGERLPAFPIILDSTAE